MVVPYFFMSLKRSEGIQNAIQNYRPVGIFLTSLLFFFFKYCGRSDYSNIVVPSCFDALCVHFINALSSHTQIISSQ